MYNQKFSYFLSIISRSCEVKTRSFRVNVSTESALQVSQLTDEILVHYRAGILHTMQGGDNKWVMLCFDWITRVDEHRRTRVMGFEPFFFPLRCFATLVGRWPDCHCISVTCTIVDDFSGKQSLLSFSASIYTYIRARESKDDQIEFISRLD